MGHGGRCGGADQAAAGGHKVLEKRPVFRGIGVPKTGRKNRPAGPGDPQGALMGGRVDTPGSPRHDGDPTAGKFRSQVVCEFLGLR